jgi:hypothetical protein
MADLPCTHCAELVGRSFQALIEAGTVLKLLVAPCPMCGGAYSVHRHGRNGFKDPAAAPRLVPSEYLAAYRLGGIEALLELREAERE